MVNTTNIFKFRELFSTFVWNYFFEFENFEIENFEIKTFEIENFEIKNFEIKNFENLEVRNHIRMFIWYFRVEGLQLCGLSLSRKSRVEKREDLWYPTIKFCLWQRSCDSGQFSNAWGSKLGWSSGNKTDP